ncbi:MAG: hypothetical protein L0191_20865, partial [Acidobacteria bacterium]|nr:hypothetical protein [Acidobacteriota bacterium]
MNRNLPLSLARRVPPAPGDARRAERVLATARAFLAGASLVAVYFDPTQPSRYASLAYLLFLVYVVHSALIVILLPVRPKLTPAFVWGVHGVDLIWPILTALFTEGPNSPFFVFFSFVLLAAAYRWGFRETLATAVAAVVLLFIHAFLLSSGAGS